MGTYRATRQYPETGDETTADGTNRREAIEALRRTLEAEWQAIDDEADARTLEAWWQDEWREFRTIRIEQIA